MYSMMNEIKQLLTEGGTKVLTTYAVDIGDALWSALYRYIEQTYPCGKEPYCSKYAIDGIFEDAAQKFAILFDRAENKYYRLNFSLTEAEGFKPEETLIEVTKTYTPVAQFNAAEVEAFIQEYAKKKDEEKEKKQEEPKEDNDKEPVKEEEAKDPEEEKDDSEEDEDKKKKKAEKKFSFDSLEEIPEYVELQNQFSDLTNQINELNATIE